jgi:hypothetical protein
VQQVSTSGVNVSWLFIEEFETAGAVERVENCRSETGSTSSEEVRVP